jgi:hypothetical protein
MRRLVYAADQLNAKNGTLKERDAYINRLECQIIQRRFSSRGDRTAAAKKAAQGSNPRQRSATLAVHNAPSNAAPSSDVGVTPVLRVPRQGDRCQHSQSLTRVGRPTAPQSRPEQAQTRSRELRSCSASRSASSSERPQRGGGSSNMRTAAVAQQNACSRVGVGGQHRQNSRSVQRVNCRRGSGHALDSTGETGVVETDLDCACIPGAPQHDLPSGHTIATGECQGRDLTSTGRPQEDPQGDAQCQFPPLPSIRYPVFERMSRARFS